MVGSAESVPGKVMESVIMKGLGALDTEGPDQLFLKVAPVDYCRTLTYNWEIVKFQYWGWAGGIQKKLSDDGDVVDEPHVNNWTPCPKLGCTFNSSNLKPLEMVLVAILNWRSMSHVCTFKSQLFKLSSDTY